MPFDAEEALVVSNAFREAVTNRLSTPQRAMFELMLQRWFALKNIRNAQLWVRPGQVQRNFINDRIGQLELETRYLVANLFVNQGTAPFPTKVKAWSLPLNEGDIKKTFEWLNDNYIREYAWRMYFTDFFFIIEYAADSSTPNALPDFDSPEFEDLVSDNFDDF